MNFINENLLTILILLPVFGAIAVIAHQMFWKQESQLKWVTFAITFVNFVVSLFLLSSATPSNSGFFFEKNVPWISAINTNYHIGVDGLSLWLFLAIAFIFTICVLFTCGVCAA